jgi:methylated-DNA-[protein]-cysteine S-methyltransferase
MNPKSYYTEFSSPIGTVQLRGTAVDVRGLFMAGQSNCPPLPLDAARDEHPLRTARTQVEEFLGGQRRTFSLPIKLVGPQFQLRVWEELLSIPYGETKTYAQIAGAIGAPRASRAVGSANRCNPLLILVPCHRVVAADGTLGGYSGGAEIKRFLLNLERESSPEAPAH